MRTLLCCFLGQPTLNEAAPVAREGPAVGASAVSSPKGLGNHNAALSSSAAATAQPAARQVSETSGNEALVSSGSTSKLEAELIQGTDYSALLRAVSSCPDPAALLLLEGTQDLPADAPLPPHHTGHPPLHPQEQRTQGAPTHLELGRLQLGAEPHAMPYGGGSASLPYNPAGGFGSVVQSCSGAGAAPLLRRVQAAYGGCTSLRLTANHLNEPLSALLGCSTPYDYQLLLAGLAAAEPLLHAALRDGCRTALEGGAEGGADIDGGVCGGGPPLVVAGHPQPYGSTVRRTAMAMTLQARIVTGAPAVRQQHVDAFSSERHSGLEAAEPDAPGLEASGAVAVAVVIRYLQPPPPPPAVEASAYDNSTGAAQRAASPLAEQLQRAYGVLAALPGMVTLLSADGREVLYQNAESVSYMGLRSRTAAAGADGGGASADGDGYGRVSGCSNVYGDHEGEGGGVLLELFEAAAEGQVEEMLACVAAGGGTWRGIVLVPALPAAAPQPLHAMGPAAAAGAPTIAPRAAAAADVSVGRGRGPAGAAPRSRAAPSPLRGPAREVPAAEMVSPGTGPGPQAAPRGRGGPGRWALRLLPPRPPRKSVLGRGRGGGSTPAGSGGGSGGGGSASPGDSVPPPVGGAGASGGGAGRPEGGSLLRRVERTLSASVFAPFGGGGAARAPSFLTRGAQQQQQQAQQRLRPLPQGPGEAVASTDAAAAAARGAGGSVGGGGSFDAGGSIGGGGGDVPDALYGVMASRDDGGGGGGDSQHTQSSAAGSDIFLGAGAFCLMPPTAGLGSTGGAAGELATAPSYMIDAACGSPRAAPALRTAVTVSLGAAPDSCPAPRAPLRPAPATTDGFTPNTGDPGDGAPRRPAAAATDGGHGCYSAAPHRGPHARASTDLPHSPGAAAAAAARARPSIDHHHLAPPGAAFGAAAAGRRRIVFAPPPTPAARGGLPSSALGCAAPLSTSTWGLLEQELNRRQSHGRSAALPAAGSGAAGRLQQQEQQQGEWQGGRSAGSGGGGLLGLLGPGGPAGGPPASGGGGGDSPAAGSPPAGASPRIASRARPHLGAASQLSGPAAGLPYHGRTAGAGREPSSRFMFLVAAAANSPAAGSSLVCSRAGSVTGLGTAAAAAAAAASGSSGAAATSGPRPDGSGGGDAAGRRIQLLMGLCAEGGGGGAGAEVHSPASRAGREAGGGAAAAAGADAATASRVAVCAGGTEGAERERGAPELVGSEGWAQAGAPQGCPAPLQPQPQPPRGPLKPWSLSTGAVAGGGGSGAGWQDGGGGGVAKPARAAALEVDAAKAGLAAAAAAAPEAPTAAAAAAAAADADAPEAPPVDAAADAAGGGWECVWHEVAARRLVDPGSGRPALLLVAVDVTARVAAERRIAEVLDAEHRLLESIFPRHVLEAAARRQQQHQEDSPQVQSETYDMEALQDDLQASGILPALGAAAAAATSATASGGRCRGLLVQMPHASECSSLATYHPNTTILFADIVGFTEMCHSVPPTTVMRFLNKLYSRLDKLLDQYDVYKVETIGDCYMVAAGLMMLDAEGFTTVRGPDSPVDELHAAKAMAFAQAMLVEAARVTLPTTGRPVVLRIGLHSGPVMSGIVGSRMPRFCLFGDTVNTASRMESTCRLGAIHVSRATRECLPEEEDEEEEEEEQEGADAEARAEKKGTWKATGGVQVKGVGMMDTWTWEPARAANSAAAVRTPRHLRASPRRRVSNITMGRAPGTAAAAAGPHGGGGGGAARGLYGGGGGACSGRLAVVPRARRASCVLYGAAGGGPHRAAALRGPAYIGGRACGGAQGGDGGGGGAAGGEGGATGGGGGASAAAAAAAGGVARTHSRRARPSACAHSARLRAVSRPQASVPLPPPQHFAGSARQPANLGFDQPQGQEQQQQLLQQQGQERHRQQLLQGQGQEREHPYQHQLLLRVGCPEDDDRRLSLDQPSGGGIGLIAGAAGAGVWRATAAASPQR